MSTGGMESAGACGRGDCFANMKSGFNLFVNDKMRGARQFVANARANHPGLRDLMPAELERVALEYYGDQAGNCSTDAGEVKY